MADEDVPPPRRPGHLDDEPTHHVHPHSRYRAPVNIAAIGSLVAGVIGLVGLLPGLLGIIAICCAIVGHKQAADTGRGTKLAIAGLLLSLLCLARGLTGLT